MRRLSDAQYRVISAVDAWHRDPAHTFPSGQPMALWSGDMLRMQRKPSVRVLWRLQVDGLLRLDVEEGYIISPDGEAALAYGREKGYVT